MSTIIITTITSLVYTVVKSLILVYVVVRELILVYSDVRDIVKRSKRK